MTRALLICALALLVLGMLAAQAAPRASAEELPPLPDAPELPALAPATPSQRWLSHEISLASSIWPGQLPDGVDRVWFELEYEPRLSGELGAGFTLTAQVLLRASQGKQPADPQLRIDESRLRAFSGSYHSNPDRQVVLPKEAQLGWSGYGAEVAAGYQILTWGKADGVRPLDVFITEDLSDPLRSETLGLPAVTSSYGRYGFSLEGAWVPFLFTNNLAVDASNPWSIVPRVPGAHFQDPRRKPDWHDGEFGFRLAFSNQAWDLGLQSSRTRDRSPSLLHASPDQNGLAIAPEYRRSWTHGASVVRTIDRYLLKADLAYVDYAVEQGKLLKDGVRLVTGAEAHGQIGANGSFTFLLQYALDTTTPGKVVQDEGLLSSPYHWFRHALLGSLRALFSPRFEGELKALVELQHGSAVASATLTYHPTDAAALWCEGSFVRGPEDTWLGHLDFADRIVVGVTFNAET